VFAFKQVFSRAILFVKGNLISWAIVMKKKQKLNLHWRNSLSQSHSLSTKSMLCCLDFELHAWLVTPLNFKPITSSVIWKIHYSNLCIRFGTRGERLYESAAAPTSHSATDPAEFDVVCRTKPNLQNQTDSNAALLLYLTHQLGSAHEWSGVWNGPNLGRTRNIHRHFMLQ